MNQFQLFDAVELTETIPLSGDFSNASTSREVALVGTIGAIVEVFNTGEAFMVELFGGWVIEDDQGDFVPAERSQNGSFMETIGWRPFGLINFN